MEKKEEINNILKNGEEIIRERRIAGGEIYLTNERIITNRISLMRKISLSSKTSFSPIPLADIVSCRTARGIPFFSLPRLIVIYREEKKKMEVFLSLQIKRSLRIFIKNSAMSLIKSCLQMSSRLRVMGQLLIKRRFYMSQEARSKFIFLMIVVMFLIIFLGAYITKASAAGKGNAEAGKKIYDARCGLCHGAAGKGDGPAGASTNPKAADFTDKAKMNKSDDELFKLISDGVKGTAMMGFASSLSEQERQDVIAYIRTFSKK